MDEFAKGDNVKVLLDPNDEIVYVAQVTDPDATGGGIEVKVMPFKDENDHPQSGQRVVLPPEQVFHGPSHYGDLTADPSASRFHHDPVAEVKRLLRRAGEGKFTFGDRRVSAGVVAEIQEKLVRLKFLESKLEEIVGQPSIVPLGTLKKGEHFKYISKPDTLYVVLNKWGPDVVEAAPMAGGRPRRSHAGTKVVV